MPNPAPQPALQPIIRRVAIPLLVFSAALFVLLLLSFLFLLPRLTRVDVSGVARTGVEVQAYRAELLKRVSEQERMRERAVLPVQDPVFDALKNERGARAALPLLRGHIVRAAQSLVPGKEAVFLQRLALHPGTKSVRITGDVRNVGASSMTVLAAFVERLRQIPLVSEVSFPRFERREDPGAGPHSPFTASLLLQ